MKDMPDTWREPSGDPGVQVVIPRHTFTQFALRAVDAFAIVEDFTVTHGTSSTTVEFTPHSYELVWALRAVIEPGETVLYGSRAWSVEWCKLLGYE